MAATTPSIPATTAASRIPPPDAVAANLSSQAGDYAYDFLRDETYTKLTVEVDWVTGHKPDSADLDAVVEALEQLAHKDPIEVVWDDELPDQGAPEWTYAAAEDMELAWRDRYRDAETGEAVIYYLYLDGHSEYDGDSSYVLGYAYHGSSLIMFEERIAATGGGLPLVGSVGATVAVHELGHLLGLVENGIPMVEDHKDPDHGDHDIDSDCIMYWAANTDSVTEMLGLTQPGFDDACLADVAAAGGRG